MERRGSFWRVLVGLMALCFVLTGCSSSGEAKEKTQEEKVEEEAGTLKEEKEATAFEPKIEMSIDGEDGFPEFTIKTNLPDKAVSEMEVTTENDIEYLYQQELTVTNGEAKSEIVSNNGEALQGVYSIGILLLPSEQPKNVLEVIGEKGENLAGDIVNDSMETYNWVQTTFQYESPVEVTKTKTFDDVYVMIGTAMTMAFGSDYEMSYDDSGITIDTWKSGLAALAVLAKNGDASSLDQWNSVVESVKNMTVETKENAMTANGYEDKILVVNVLNDVSKDNTLLTVSDGVVFYDAVNNINILGVE